MEEIPEIIEPSEKDPIRIYFEEGHASGIYEPVGDSDD